MTTSTAATITADHIRQLHTAHFENLTSLTVLAVDLDGQLKVMSCNTATTRGAEILYDDRRLNYWLEDVAMLEGDAELIAQELNNKMANR